MLLSSDYSIERSINFNFVYDDGNIKKSTLSIGDIAEITYNAGRIRKTVTGKVTRIDAGNETVTHPIYVCHEPIPVNCDHYHWWIMLDSTGYDANRTERIDCKRILDITVVAGANSSTMITSPVGETNVTNFRVYYGMLQLSVDNGQNWMNVCQLPESDVDVNPRDKALADKISSIIPKCVNPSDKADLILAIIDLVKENSAEHRRRHKENREKRKEKLIEDVVATLQDAGYLTSDGLSEDDVASLDDIADMIKEILGDDYEAGEVDTILNALKIINK